MFGWVLFGIALLGTGVFAVLQSQQRSPQGMFGVISIGASAILFIAFFLLPWVSIPISIDQLMNMVPKDLVPQEVWSQLESLGILQEIRQFSNQFQEVTAWTLAVDLPTSSIDFQFALFTVLGSAVLAALVGASALMSQEIAKVGGLLLAAISIIGLVSIFFSLRRIRGFGVEPGFFAPLLDFLGIRIGPGVWITFVGLALCIFSGVLLSQQSFQRNTTRSRTRQRGIF